MKKVFHVFNKANNQFLIKRANSSSGIIYLEKDYVNVNDWRLLIDFTHKPDEFNVEVSSIVKIELAIDLFYKFIQEHADFIRWDWIEIAYKINENLLGQTMFLNKWKHKFKDNIGEKNILLIASVD